MTQPLFRQLLGESFDLLPESIRRLHDGRSKTLVGRCDVQRGLGLVSRLIGWITSLPPAGDNQIMRMTISCDACFERWQRHFVRHVMQSKLTAYNGILHERLGPVRFRFKVFHDNECRVVRWQLIHVSTLGIALPVGWFSEVLAEEFDVDGKYYFNVRAALPLVGMLAQYKGWLNV